MARIITSLAMIAGLMVAAPAAAQAVVPDDNGRIAYINNTELWIMDADGANREKLLATSELQAEGGPSWSPDGTKIALAGFTATSGPNWDIWVFDVASRTLTQVTDTPTLSEIMPAWSPDGSTIAFVVQRQPAVDDLWLMDASGLNPRLLVSDATRAEAPAWSPDGTRIAYVAFDTSQNLASNDSEIWVVNADGTGKTQLTDTIAGERSPSWSPDGAAIAYGLWGTQTSSRIWVMDADGSDQRLLAAGPGRLNGQPAWSPDGSHLAFSSFGVIGPTPGEESAVYTMKADGTDWTRLTTEAGAYLLPAWQPLPGVHRVGLVDPDQGMWHLREQGVVTSFFYGNPDDLPFLGDWDCDGEDTPGLYRQSDGYVYLRNSNTAGIADVKYFFGDPGDLPIAGDFDGDGCDTVSIYRPSEGKVYVHNELGSGDQGLGAAELSYYFGNPGDKPFTGDFDGDGIDTVGLHRASTGLVYFRNSHTPGIADLSFIFGDPGDRFVAGDWTEDGTDSPGLYRPTDAKFYFRNTNTQGVADASLIWGSGDWLPVTGDFHLSSTTEVKVFFGRFHPTECDVVAPVTRKVRPPAVLAAAMKELLEGPTTAEQAAGYISTFSSATAGMFSWATIDAGTARIDFRDLSAVIPGASASCASGALLAELDATATQFPTVDRAVFSLNGDVRAFYEWLQRSAPPGF